MNHQALLLLFGLLCCPALSQKCLYNWTQPLAQVTCHNIDQEDYLTHLSTNITLLLSTDVVPDKITLSIADCKFLHVDHWIYWPWETLLDKITSFKLTNCSVASVRSLSKFSQMETLDLSMNNISNYKFLAKLKRLRFLHLGFNNFSDDSYVLSYIQKENSKLKLVNLTHSNFSDFTVPFNHIETYDLSFGSKLRSVYINDDVYARPKDTNLILRGNHHLVKIIKNPIIFVNDRKMSYRQEHNFVCLSSIDLSSSNITFSNYSLLKSVKISNKINLSNNLITSLNSTNFPLETLSDSTCGLRLTISIDFSKVSLKHISPNYFANVSLNRLKLNNNDFQKLDNSTFKRADINILDLSDSNISSIGPSVFSYLNVGVLNLSRNKLVSLKRVFQDIESVRNLDLSYNPIEALDQSTFKNCSGLEKIDLSNTFVGSFGDKVFHDLPSLKSVLLSVKGYINTSSLYMYASDLTIVNSSFEHLLSDNFRGAFRLKELTFHNSSVLDISTQAFRGLNNLHALNITSFKWSKDVSVFKYLPRLNRLDLSFYDLKKIDVQVKGLHSLALLNLSSNLISSVDHNSFSDLGNLKILSLARNEISTIVLGTFASLKKLTNLYLNKNHLEQLPLGLFSNLDSLELLDLSENMLYRTKPHVLISASLPKLKFLYLQSNRLGNEFSQGENLARQSEFSVLARHSSLTYIDINHNEWRCVTLLDVLLSFKSKNISLHTTNPDYSKTNINGISCTS